MVDFARVAMFLCGVAFFIGTMIFLAHEAVYRVRHKHRISDEFYTRREHFGDMPRIPGKVTDIYGDPK